MTSVRGTAATILAPSLLAPLRADARPQALLAISPHAAMLAYLRFPAFLAVALAALVWSDAAALALLALAPAAVMLSRT